MPFVYVQLVCKLVRSNLAVYGVIFIEIELERLENSV